MGDKIHPIIDTVPFWYEKGQSNVNAYLIRGRQTAIVDTGPPQASLQSVEKVLSAFDVRAAEIDLILNTHGHFDHIGCNAMIQNAGNAKILIHKNDAVFIEDPPKSFDIYFAPMHKATGRVTEIEQAKAAFIKDAGPALTIDRKLEDNDTIDLGDGVRLQVIHLPGHTPGSVGYYLEDEGILVAGDSIPGLNGPGGMLPIIFDLAAYIKTLERLIRMPVQCIMQCHPYRGLHSPPTTIRQGGEVRRFLEDSQMVAKQLENAVRQHADVDDQPLMEIADLVIAALPEALGFKSIAEQPLPQFSLMTIFYAFSSIRGQGV